MTELPSTPLYRSLTRTTLFMGADRELVLVSGIMFGFAVFMSLGVAVLFMMVAPLALLFWCGIVWGLRVVAKRDPLYRQVYIKNCRYQAYIPSASTPFRGE